ncbi:MAG TPA: MFS transporter [Gaiellaceae bacterium]|nr:MFS transporter [Gaiellaceae bacterium]
MRSLFRLVFGAEVDRALRPVLAVAFVGGVATSTGFPFLGIYALKHLGASQGQLSVGFLGSALAAGVAGYVGGHLSDHVGRRPVILVGWIGLCIVPIGFLFVGHHVFVGLPLLASFGLFGSLGQAADQAMVADLVAPEKHELAYAGVRVAQNLGVSFGPVLGGVLLLGNSWPHLFIGMFVLAACATGMAFRFLPSRGVYTPETAPARGSFAVIRRDRAFLVFMGSAVLAAMTYVAFDVLLPISLVGSHGIAPSTWGFLVVVNPILVTLVQLRLTRATAQISGSVKLAIAMPLMGLPFLVLSVNDSVPVVMLIVLVFVIGEMLWVPTSQAVVAAFAPAEIRGAYMGAFSGSWQAAWALTPFFGLQLRSAYGDADMWRAVAVVSVLAGIAGAAAAWGRDPAPAVASSAA